MFFGDIQRGIFKLHLKPERAQVPPMKQWPATKRRPSNIREKRLLMETVYGMSKVVGGKMTVTNVKRYPAEKVNPPEGVKSADWIKGGFKN